MKLHQYSLWFSSRIVLNQLLSNKIMHIFFFSVENALSDRKHSFTHSLSLIAKFYYVCVEPSVEHSVLILLCFIRWILPLTAMYTTDSGVSFASTNQMGFFGVCY